MSNPLQNADKKRQDIVLAAKTLFLGQGYSISSMDAIAAGAGVTKQTVYRYYPSKETLFAAVMQEIRNADRAPYQFSSGEIEDELMNFGSQLLEFHLRPEALGVYRLMLTEGARNKGLFETFKNTGPRRFQEPLAAFLKARCIKLNDPDFAANMFCSMILTARNIALMSHSTRMQKSSQQAHVQQVVSFLLPSLCGS